MMLRKYNGLLIVVIFIAGIIAYSNSFDCSFHFDDGNVFHSSVTDRPTTLEDWIRLFPNRPVGIITFYLNFQLHGLDVGGYHLVNLIIHLINAFLVWWLVWLTLSSPVMRDSEISKHKTVMAFLTGLLFVTHPLATQSVTYIVQRFASLAALFYLLSFVLFVSGRLWDGMRSVRWLLFLGSILCAVLGLFSKEIVFTLPFAMVLYEFCFLRKAPANWKLKDAGWIIPLSILLIFIAQALRILTIKHFGTIQPIQGYAYSISMKEYLFTQFSVILTYLRLFILPVGQTFDYDYPVAAGFFKLKTLLSFSLLLTIFTAGVLLFKRYRLISFGIFWFFLTLSVESSFLPISQNVIFEHRTYLPSFGFFIALVGLFFYFFKERHVKIAVVLLLVMAAANTALTYQRNKVWKNEFTFWADNLNKSPNKARVINNFGQVMLAAGKIKEAVYFYDRAIRLNPHYIYFYNNRGAAYERLGQYAQALGDYNQAIRLNPNHPGAYYNRAIIYARQGQHQRAIADYQQAIRLRPDAADAHINLGSLYVRMGEYQKAIESSSKAVRLKPRDPNGYYNRGEAYLKLGLYHQAVDDFSTVVRLQPGDYMAYHQRGRAYGQLGRYTNELADYDQAILLKQNYAAAYSDRAAAFFKQKDKTAGCRDAKKACELGACEMLEKVKSKGACH